MGNGFKPSPWRGAALLALALLALGACPDVAMADSLTLGNGTTQQSVADNAVGSLAWLNHTIPAAGPSWTQTTTATDLYFPGSTYGISSASVATDLQQSAFDFEFTGVAFHRQNNSTKGRTQSFGYIYFTALEDLDYTLSGSYSSIGSGATTGMRVFLLEEGTANYLFDQYQTSGATNASLSLSGSGLTGTLVSGKSYRFFYDYGLQHSGYNATVTTSGELLLTFNASGGTGEPVPEPSSWALVGVTLGGMLVLRRRQLRPS